MKIILSLRRHHYVARVSIFLIAVALVAGMAGCGDEVPPEELILIGGVPDTNQPPTQNLVTTIPFNYCAPMAMINVLEYWDVAMGHANAYNVSAGLPAKNATEYLGYFMDTNNNGSPDRGNVMDGHSGTYAKDISPGTLDFVRWDAGNQFPIIPDQDSPTLPAGKIGYIWAVIDDYCGWGGSPTGFDFYMATIDAGRPLVVCFRYWNPNPTGIQKFDLATNEKIDVFAWGSNVSYSEDPHPEEEWECPEYDAEDPEYCVGHAVTGVGYVLNWDPDGDDGPLPLDDYVIVHDNWDTTPENVAIPWDNWNSSHAVNPAGNPPAKQDLTISIGGFPCGSVTTPGVGTFTCDAGAVVNLVATTGPAVPGESCVFVNWTGDVGTIADVNAASTTIAMNGDYSITANFLFTPVIPI